MYSLPNQNLRWQQISVTIDNGISNFGTFDNNYYCRPTDDIATIYTEYIGTQGNVSTLLTLECGNQRLIMILIRRKVLLQSQRIKS